MIQEVLDRIQAVNDADFKEMNGRQIISVSKLEDYVTEPFDKDGQAERCAEKGKADPSYKYAGMTAEEIKAGWEEKAAESRRYGTLLDSYAEQRIQGTPDSLELWKLDNNFDSDQRLMANCRGFDQFCADISSKGFEVAGREITVYVETPSTVGDMPFDPQTEDGRNVVVGRIDCLFEIPARNKFLVVDWKTTEDIKTSAFRGKRMKGPAMNWEDCDMGKYTIQLHVYKTALTQTYRLAEPKDVAVCICNLRRDPDPATGRFYRLFKENFPYDARAINRLADFAVKKRALLARMSGGKSGASK